MPLNYFHINPNTQTEILKIKGFNFPSAVPSGTSTVNVLNNLRWCNSGSIEEVPGLILEEFSLDFGAWTASLARLAQAATQVAEQGASSDPYTILYPGTPTGFKYILPYLINSGSIRGSISNSWDEEKDTISELLKSKFPTMSKVAETVGGSISPGFGAEKVQRYTSTSPRVITISFPLYNTVSVEDANNNFSFISLFGFQNLKTRTGFLTYMPPKIYSVSMLEEGGIYMPAAMVEKFDVESIGTLRSMSDFGNALFGANTSGKRLVPEAYKVTISLKELIPQSSNIMAGEIGESRVKVVGDTSLSPTLKQATVQPVAP
jgi:hypothetical protein